MRVDFFRRDAHLGNVGFIVMNLQIVVPCYNEQLVLPNAAGQLDALLSRLVERGKVSNDSRITFIDDGSCDRTWALIEQEATRRNRVAGIKLSRNRGHQNALLAGMMSVYGDAVITIDADLQDDINAIERMADEYLKGYDIVFTGSVLIARPIRDSNAALLPPFIICLLYSDLNWCTTMPTSG
jgi:glycosyltransferase involved in cell wall biosynthesis